jgi:NAD(P)-dependent dehydrogenase (short-subunit alcohol dehydrogenase family)
MLKVCWNCRLGIALWQSSIHMTDSEFPSNPINFSSLKSESLRVLYLCHLLSTLVDQFDSIFRTNTTGPYYLSRALMRSWLGLPISLSSSSSEVNLTADDGQPKKNLKGKQILFVSSISGLVAMTPQYQAAYNASKAGVTMLAKVRRGVLPC